MPDSSSPARSQNPSTHAWVVVAAGRGLRAGGGVPKQYRLLHGLPVLAHTLRAISQAAPGSLVQVVIHPDDAGLYADAIDAAGPLAASLLPPSHGGTTRQTSVLAGLEALASHAPTQVLIHDAARPFLSPEVVARALEALQSSPAAVPGVAVVDTIKQVDAASCVVATPARAHLRAVQTPQAFQFDAILAAHRNAAVAGIDHLSDDAAVAEWAGLPVHIFAGDPANMKLTSEADFEATAHINANDWASLNDIRTGQGFDVHAFGPGDHVWLGGVKVPHGFGLVGHSDADVLMHAITDAIFGALSDGDIGSHFPPSDPQWKGAASDIFLRHARDRVTARGGRIAHVDGTVICESPKVGPHRDAIRARLAEILELPMDRVAVKATTSEQLGFTGRREGIAALATATLRLPFA